MSGPQVVPDWGEIARALGASGCDLTDYGTWLAEERARLCQRVDEAAPDSPEWDAADDALHLFDIRTWKARP